MGYEILSHGVGGFYSLPMFKSSKYWLLDSRLIMGYCHYAIICVKSELFAYRHVVHRYRFVLMPMS